MLCAQASSQPWMAMAVNWLCTTSLGELWITEWDERNLLYGGERQF